MNLSNYLSIRADISFIKRDIKTNIEFITNDNIINHFISTYSKVYLQTFSDILNGHKNKNGRYVKILHSIDDTIKEKEKESGKESGKIEIEILTRRKEIIFKSYNHNKKEFDSLLTLHNHLNEILVSTEGRQEIINIIKLVINSIYDKMIDTGFDFTFGSIFLKELIHVSFSNSNNSDDEIISFLDRKIIAFLLNMVPLINDKRKLELINYSTFTQDLMPGIKSKYFDFFLKQINQDNNDFDYFFMLELRQTELGRVKEFLRYHALQYNGDYFEFLMSATENFRHLLQEKQMDKVTRWIEENKKENLKIIKIRKPKVEKRTKTDDFTELSNTQTALLFHYLKKSKAIINDFTIQSDTEISKAISTITGYSDNTIRRKLSQANKIKEIDKEDLVVTQKKLKEVIQLINKDLE